MGRRLGKILRRKGILLDDRREIEEQAERRAIGALKSRGPGRERRMTMPKVKPFLARLKRRRLILGFFNWSGIPPSASASGREPKANYWSRRPKMVSIGTPYLKMRTLRVSTGRCNKDPS
ncbi:MAG: hypothetical protein NC930_03100 [Candidatus Omnitrophica bacterium]|nr:hypothetical protein [Candidatus Omnitrophota bacterium]